LQIIERNPSGECWPNMCPLEGAYSERLAWYVMEGRLLYTFCLSGALLVGMLAL
jgi:hypothetical protein